VLQVLFHASILKTIPCELQSAFAQVVKARLIQRVARAPSPAMTRLWKDMYERF
jgi:hypothetical protein